MLGILLSARNIIVSEMISALKVYSMVRGTYINYIMECNYKVR